MTHTDNGTSNGVGFREVTVERPCPVCQKSSWCSVSSNGDWCNCRHVSEGGKEKVDKNGDPYFVHRLGKQAESISDANRPEPRFSLASGNGELADPVTLDKVYSVLLGGLALEAKHKKDLERRGLTSVAGAICYATGYPAGYRSLGRGRTAGVSAVIKAGLEVHLPHVPGFFIQQREGGKPNWSLGGWGGLLIPVRDEESRIRALLLRKDPDDDGPKYRYLSSKKRGGAGPGAPVHVPLFEGDKIRVRITEGALKADVATKLSNVLTIGLPGVSTGHREVVRIMRKLGTKKAILALDADARKNLTVANALVRLLALLRKKEFAVELERWPIESGKGIDDLLTAGGKPDLVSDFDGVSAAVAEILEAAQVADPPAGGVPEGKEQSDHPDEALNDPHRLARFYLERQAHPDHSKLAFFREQFWVWTGTYWIARPDAEMNAELNKFCKYKLDADFAAIAAMPVEEEKKRPTVPKVTTGLVSNVVQALSGKTLVRQEVVQPSWLGDGRPDRDYITLLNGLLDLEALFGGQAEVLRPHSPLWFSPACLPYGFNPEATCPRWIAFLDRNLGGAAGFKARMLQQYAGYLLTFDTSLQKFLMLIGEGANGKSVICAVLRAMLGEVNVSSVPLEMFGDKFRLAGTLGKLANIIAEVGEMDRVSEGQLKAFVTGDPLEFERKFKTPFTAKPTARIVMATNNPPRFEDKSDGIWRRILLLICSVQIPKDERVAGMDSTEWWYDAGELPGILNWALAGLHQLRQQRRFDVPEQCECDLNLLRADLNPARRFLDEHCRAGAGETEKAVLYARYKEWCRANGHHELASNKFAVEVFRAFPAAKEGKPTWNGQRVRTFAGVELIAEASAF